MNKIPFSKPYLTGLEKSYVNDAMDKLLLSGDHTYTKKCNDFFEKMLLIKKVLLTTSCSMALDMTAILLDLEEGDEIIMPSFNFVSMANSIIARGAIPVFADIDEKTLNIDLKDVSNKITTKTKAIYPVHYAGVSCDMDVLMDLADRNNVFVVEDAAQAVNAKYKGKYLGSIGDMGCYSFHETKNYTCGEGGALLIKENINWGNRAEIIREKGTNRTQFFRGEIDKYTWVDKGSSYLPSDLLAAMLYGQLENLTVNINMRKKIYNLYYEQLLPLAQKGFFLLPTIPAYAQSNYHIFYILLNSENDRNSLMDYLKKNDISACFHYIPLHSSPAGYQFSKKKYNLPVTDSMSSRILRLPLYCEMEEENVSYIVEKIKSFFKKI